MQAYMRLPHTGQCQCGSQYDPVWLVNLHSVSGDSVSNVSRAMTMLILKLNGLSAPNVCEAQERVTNIKTQYTLESTFYTATCQRLKPVNQHLAKVR